MHVEMKRIYFGLSCNSRLDRAQVFSRLDRAQEVTLAIFHISGKTSILNEELNIAASGLHKISAASTNCTEILS